MSLRLDLKIAVLRSHHRTQRALQRFVRFSSSARKAWDNSALQSNSTRTRGRAAGATGSAGGMVAIIRARSALS